MILSNSGLVKGEDLELFLSWRCWCLERASSKILRSAAFAPTYKILIQHLSSLCLLLNHLHYGLYCVESSFSSFGFGESVVMYTEEIDHNLVELQGDICICIVEYHCTKLLSPIFYVADELFFIDIILQLSFFCVDCTFRQQFERNNRDSSPSTLDHTMHSGVKWYMPRCVDNLIVLCRRTVCV